MLLLLACTNQDLATLDARLVAAGIDSSQLDSGFGAWSPISADAPTADAGADSEVDLGWNADFDGTASSDPDGDELSWEWTLSSVPATSSLTDADLVNSEEALGYFTPDVEGDFELQLSVSDGTSEASDTVVVTVVATTSSNTAPVAHAGMGTSGSVGDTLSFDASSSYDPDADDVSYRWRFAVVPNGSDRTSGDIEGRYTETPSFVADVGGTFQLEVRVMDDSTFSTDTTTAVISTPANGVPVPDTTGSPTRVGYSWYVNMRAEKSSDPDGDALDYSWSFLSVPSGSALVDADWDDADSDHGSFQPDVAGVYRTQVEVSDGTDSATAVVAVRMDASTADNPPMPELSVDADFELGDTVEADSSGSWDLEGATLSHRWAFSSLPSASALANADITDRRTDFASFVPDVAGTYELRLSVDDGVNISREVAELFVAGPGGESPVADAAADQEVALGAAIYVDGSGSYDPEGESITTTWTFRSIPSSSSLTNSDITKPKSAVTNFSPDVAGDYVLRLVVDDGHHTDSDTVVFTVL